MSLWTGDLFLLCIHLKLCLSKAIRHQVLGSDCGRQGSDQVNVQVFTVGQIGAAHVTCIDIVFTGHALALFQTFLDIW